MVLKRDFSSTSFSKLHADVEEERRGEERCVRDWDAIN